MAMHLADAARRASPGRRRSRRPVMSEINVTPFVDVMLVLLIVFIITAPLLTAGVPVDLPKSQAKPLSEPVEPLVITLDAAGDIYLQETPVPLAALVARLEAVVASKSDTRIYIRADAGLAYGEVIALMGHVQAAGFERVALVSEWESGDGG
ncbi:MAG: biopolymer transporter ExbD [Alphaproteobacteria bacterium]|nr:biopolymer transporter ExbD [Alphaproteobacteria bacterium]MDA7988029.1 biopolymer transporter ExbD [Alphaproteobacteria bacterium]MDA8001442.1 biopolymer transporter ExbD [Alphaproteobacteria bacterium]MDA8004402.1 biopolymer transporter ExbD [Alphaproteobacteria bacterium]MDA8006396.1 biopolymer transporter ExbD [Alphaproteobacteria bacterium]